MNNPGSYVPKLYAVKGTEEVQTALKPKCLRRDEVLEVRLLPHFLDMERGVLWLAEHLFPGRDIAWHSVPRARAACPRQSNAALVKPDDCPACAAGLDIQASVVVYVLVKDKRRAMNLIFRGGDVDIIRRLIRDGAMEETAPWVRLWREGKKLCYETFGEHRADFAQYKLETDELFELTVSKWPIRPHLLEDMVESQSGWEKAGTPAPFLYGNVRAIRKVIPQAILIEIPFAMKAPSRWQWQKTTYEESLSKEHEHRLDNGNVGMLLGQDAESVRAGLSENIGVVALDGDYERFVKDCLRANAWLKDTASVVGRPGRCRWIFEIEDKLELVLRSHKFVRISDNKDCGEWLGRGRQCLIDGLHPGGFRYQWDGKPLLRVRADDFVLPGGYDMTGLPDELDRETRCFSDEVYKKARRRFGDAEERRPPTEEVLSDAIVAMGEKHAEDYESWLRGGFALAHWAERTGKREAALRLFRQFSARSGKFNKAECEEKWRNLISSGGASRPCTVGTIFAWAAENGWTIRSYKQKDDDDYED